MAWAVLLAGLTWFSTRNDPPTVREQRTLAEAGPVVDGAIGELVAAASDAVLALAPPEIDRGCRITPFADGATLSREVELAVPGGEERAVLERVAGRLPATWRAGVRVTTDGPRLRADAGEFVVVRGRPVADGRIRLTVDTGCRLVGGGYVRPGPGAAGAEAGVLAEALRALGGSAAGAETAVTAPCPGGGVTRTAWSGVGEPAGSPQAALAPLAGGAPVVETPQLYAFRRDGVALLADLHPDGIRVAATSGCVR